MELDEIIITGFLAIASITYAIFILLGKAKVLTGKYIGKVSKEEQKFIDYKSAARFTSVSFLCIAFFIILISVSEYFEITWLLKYSRVLGPGICGFFFGTYFRPFGFVKKEYLK